MRNILAVSVVSVSLAILVGCSGGGTPESPAGLSLSATTLALPNTVVGVTSAAMPVTLTNTGGSTLTLSGATIGGTNASDFAIAANTCGSSVAAAASCTISVTFSPASTVSYSAVLTLTDNVSGSPQVVNLTGTGIAPGASLTPTVLAFPNTVVGSVGSTLSTSLANNGSAPLTISGLSFTGANPADFSATSNCGASLAVGSTCTITVKFNPVSAASFNATLNLADNAPNSPQTVSVSGAGIAVPSANSCSTINTTSPAQPTPTANYAGTIFSGSVKAGTVGIIGASVQVYAAGTTGNGSAPTALLTTPLITDVNGNFSAPAAFTCPYSNTVLYAVATGGKAGASGTVNSGNELMTVLGVCNTLASNANYTIDEATTVASVYAMAQFMKPGAQMGATSTNALGIGLAAATMANLVNTTSGVAPGAYFTNTGVAPTAKINTLANALNDCIVQPTSCSVSLYQDSTASGGTAPTNTLDAALSIAQHPQVSQTVNGNNPLYVLGTSDMAYTPVLTAPPADWTMLVTYTGGSMSDPSIVSIDSTGNVWVGSYFAVESYFTNTGSPVFGISSPHMQEVYGGAVNVNDYMWFTDEQTNSAYNGNANNGDGAALKYNNTGAFVGGAASGGIYFPIALNMDRSANIWVADYGNPNAGVVVLTNAGVPVSGTSGYGSSQFEFPAAVATDSKCNGFVANQSSNTLTKVAGNGSSFTSFAVGEGPSGVAVDGSDNAWSANYYGSSVGLVTAAGTVLSGSNGFTGGGLNHPQGIAIDGSGNVWVANFRGPAITQLAGASATTPGAVLSPSTGWASDSGMVEAFGLALDASGNIWITNFGTNTLTEIIGLAAPVKTPLLGPVRVP